MFQKFLLFFALTWSGYYAKVVQNFNGTEKFLIMGGYQATTQTHTKSTVSLADTNFFDLNNESEFGQGHFCAGSIIGLKTILTAAHCVYAEDPQHIIVIAGTPIRTKRVKTTQILHVESITVHPQYTDAKDTPHDIALLHLKEKLVEDRKTVQRLQVSDKSYAVRGRTCIAVGWGKQGSQGNLSNAAQYIDLVVFDRAHCEREQKYIEKTFCAGDPLKGARGTCDGDTGGPLICDGELAGVNIFGSNCTNVQPSFFTDVSKYFYWIQEHFNEDVGFRSAASKPSLVSMVLKMFDIMIICYILVFGKN